MPRRRPAAVPAAPPAPQCVACAATDAERLRCVFTDTAHTAWVWVCAGKCRMRFLAQQGRDDWRSPGKAHLDPFVAQQRDPAVLAQRVEEMRRGAKLWRERQQLLPKWAGDLADIAGIRRTMPRRLFELALLHLGGYTRPAIAVALGYTSENGVKRALQLAPVRALIDACMRAQLERVISGEFGVRAQAKAAAPKAMRKVIGLAGLEGQEEAAPKPETQLRANETVLKVAGELAEKVEHDHRHHHLHQLLRTLSPEELRDVADRNVWPDRFRGVVEKLGLPAPDGR